MSFAEGTLCQLLRNGEALAEVSIIDTQGPSILGCIKLNGAGRVHSRHIEQPLVEPARWQLRAQGDLRDLKNLEAHLGSGELFWEWSDR